MEHYVLIEDGEYNTRGEPIFIELPLPEVNPSPIVSLEEESSSSSSSDSVEVKIDVEVPKPTPEERNFLWEILIWMYIQCSNLHDYQVSMAPAFGDVKGRVEIFFVGVFLLLTQAILALIALIKIRYDHHMNLIPLTPVDDSQLLLNGLNWCAIMYHQLYDNNMSWFSFFDMPWQSIGLGILAVFVVLFGPCIFDLYQHALRNGLYVTFALVVPGIAHASAKEHHITWLPVFGFLYALYHTIITSSARPELRKMLLEKTFACFPPQYVAPVCTFFCENDQWVQYFKRPEPQPEPIPIVSDDEGFQSHSDHQ